MENKQTPDDLIKACDQTYTDLRVATAKAAGVARDADCAGVAHIAAREAAFTHADAAYDDAVTALDAALKAARDSAYAAYVAVINYAKAYGKARDAAALNANPDSSD